MVCEGIKLNLYVGSKIGTFKHVKYDQNSKSKRKDTSSHLRDVKSIQKGEGIKCLTFKDTEQTEILIGRENRTIETYNLLTSQFENKTDIDFGKGDLKSISVYEDTTIAAVESGIVKVWRSKLQDGFELNAGENLEKLQHCPFNSQIIGTGGKENDLKLWNLETKQVVFQAKNVAHDWLQLRVPVWVSDICFLPDTDGKQVAICSRYGVVRLYDARAQRRPVCSVELPGQANTCITLGCSERQVLVGSGRGGLQLVDLRGEGRPSRAYRGPAGAVTAALCLPLTGHPEGVVLSTSLDRHLRVHDALTKELIHKQYMTSKLTAFLVRTSGVPLPGEEVIVKKEEKEETEDIADEEYDELFQNMEVVREENGNKRKKEKKKSTPLKAEVDSVNISEGSPSRVGQENLNESIKKLLKSTEKTKRKLHKLKKKKKSVFND